jgi:hypothetical protein
VNPVLLVFSADIFEDIASGNQIQLSLETEWAPLGAAVLWYTYYNFCRIHKTLRVTPAMEAGISDHVWGLAELLA